jgi:hypothetical protein
MSSYTYLPKEITANRNRWQTDRDGTWGNAKSVLVQIGFIYQEKRKCETVVTVSWSIQSVRDCFYSPANSRTIIYVVAPTKRTTETTSIQ